MANGWAVISGKDILVDTVSKTRRAAIINYLMVCEGRFITAVISDEDIESLWESRYNKRTDYVHEVKVEIDLP